MTVALAGLLLLLSRAGAVAKWRSLNAWQGKDRVFRHLHAF
jgi:hypothetical protein